MYGALLRVYSWPLFETLEGIIRENLAYCDMKTTNPNTAALAGFLLILPFTVLNAIVAKRVEPFFSLIRPGIHTSTLEYVLLLFVLLLIPIGALIALHPLLRRGADGKRRFYIANGATAALLLVVFTVLASALGTEIYRCDVLQIPNCD